MSRGGLTYAIATRLLKKGENLCRLGAVVMRQTRGIKPVLEDATATKQITIETAKLRYPFIVKPSPRHADDIDPGQTGTVAHGNAERDHVTVDSRLRGNHGMIADTTPLLDCRKATHHHMIANLGMATK
jgi:hypothetical protein